jgi:hypothetical protein
MLTVIQDRDLAVHTLQHILDGNVLDADTLQNAGIRLHLLELEAPAQSGINRGY